MISPKCTPVRIAPHACRREARKSAAKLSGCRRMLLRAFAPSPDSVALPVASRSDGDSQYEVKFPKPFEYLCRQDCLSASKAKAKAKGKGKGKDPQCDPAYQVPKESGLNYRFCLADGAGRTRGYVFFKLEGTGTETWAKKAMHGVDLVKAKTGLRTEPPGFEFGRDTEVDYWQRNCKGGKGKPPYQCAKPCPRRCRTSQRVAGFSDADAAVFDGIVPAPGAQALMAASRAYFEWNVRVGAEMLVPFVVTDALLRETEGLPPASPRPVPDEGGEEEGWDAEEEDGGEDYGDEGFVVGGPPASKSPLKQAMEDEEDY